MSRRVPAQASALCSSAATARSYTPRSRGFDAATANDGGDDDDLARALAESARQYDVETRLRHPELDDLTETSGETPPPRRQARQHAAFSRHPELDFSEERDGVESSDDEQDSSELETSGELETSRELETSGEASLRHPELEEPSLERTPRSWDDWARRPRHPELDDSDDEGLDTRPGIVVL